MTNDGPIMVKVFHETGSGIEKRIEKEANEFLGYLHEEGDEVLSVTPAMAGTHDSDGKIIVGTTSYTLTIVYRSLP